jgi:hypothetical protein
MVPVSISTFTARSGLEQRVSLDQFIPRIWSLVFPGMKRVSVDTLEAFWRDREGPLKPFKWQSEETSDLYYVRFDQASFKPEHIGPDVWSLSFQFREIFPGEINLEG